MASFRKLPSGKWQAIVKHSSGKRYTKTDPLKRVLVDWAADVEQRLRRGEFVDPKSGRLPLEQWWDRWQQTRSVEPSTAAKNESHWRNHVKPAFGSWPMNAITALDVEMWVAAATRKGTGAETVASALRLLKQLLAAAVKHKLLSVNVAEDVQAPTPPKHVDRFLTRQEADQLLAVVDGWQHLFCLLMLRCGLRFGEVAGLHVMRVDLMRRQLTVVETLRRDKSVKSRPKTRAGQRVVPLTDDVVVELSRHLATRPRDGLVFVGRDGGRLDYNNMRRRFWNPVVKRARLADPQPTMHDLRHTYGSWMAEGGMPLPELKELMGHSSLRALERYVHAGEARFERARRIMGASGAHEGVGDTKKPRSS